MDYAVTPFARTSDEPTTYATRSTVTTNSTQDPAENTSSTEPAMTTPSRTSVYPLASLPGLPNELLVDILSRLRLEDLFSLCLVSKGMGSVSELAMPLAQRGDAGTRAVGSKIASAVLKQACTRLLQEEDDAHAQVDPLGKDAQHALAARLKQATEEAMRVYSTVGRRYVDIPVVLSPGFPKSAGLSLLQADGWSHLKLSGCDGRTLVAFLWDLMATSRGTTQRPRKISIDLPDFAAGSVKPAIGKIEDLARCAPQLTLSGLRLSTSLIDELDNVIALGKGIEELRIDILDGHMERAEKFIGKLAGLGNLKVLQLEFHERFASISQPLVKQIAALQMDTLSLTNHDVERTRQRACVAALFTPALRKLEFSCLNFVTGALAGVGTALAEGVGIESLSFLLCFFSDNPELASLQTGVATSTSLSHLSLLIRVRRGRTAGDPDKGWLTAAQQNRSLKTLVLSNDFESQFPKALADLKTGRPDLTIEFPDKAKDDDSDSSGAFDESIEDTASQPQVEALDAGDDWFTESNAVFSSYEGDDTDSDAANNNTGSDND